MTILYFALAALALGILVFIHELGHYFMAKWVGMQVEVFSIGFGRPILKWRWQEVDWQMGWLPFGGYVRIMGMELKKKDKNTYIEPYEIEGGFFTKAPWKRILVAVAGPVANIILAFLIFCALFFIGGREKPFSEFTKVIGWVDPGAELFALGVRPGDVITEYDGKPFTSSKDHLYAAMLGDKKIEIKGERINYETGEKKPFVKTIESYPAPAALDGIRTTGITSGARYLIYDRYPGGMDNLLQEGSPMQNSGISYGDRVVWVDGELIFSMEQLSYLINQPKALLTVNRGGKTFLTRQPRVKLFDLILNPSQRAELRDWQYEANLKERFKDLYALPYALTSDNVVQSPFVFIDEESQQSAFPLHAYSPALEAKLLPGDQIIAVDGVRVSTGYDLLKALQTRRSQIIVKQAVPVASKTLWTKEDAAFERSFDVATIDALSLQIGSGNTPQEMQGYRLLSPVEPKPLAQFSLDPALQRQIQAQYAARKQKVEKIKNPSQRAKAYALLDKLQNKRLLGVALQDRMVDYNPNPIALFGAVAQETYATLKALILGYLHPKWISGPVGIVRVIHHGWAVGVGEALFWIAAISLNLAILNLLPIPVLDGGHICFALWEMLTKRRIKAKTMERLIIPFVVLLIALLVFLTFQDVSRFF